MNTRVAGPGWGWLPATLRCPRYWRTVRRFALWGPLIGGAPYAWLVFTIPFIYVVGFLPALIAGMLFAAWWVAPSRREPTWPWRAVMGALSGLGAALVALAWMLATTTRVDRVDWPFAVLIALHGVPAAVILALRAPRWYLGGKAAAARPLSAGPARSPGMDPAPTRAAVGRR